MLSLHIVRMCPTEERTLTHEHLLQYGEVYIYYVYVHYMAKSLDTRPLHPHVLFEHCALDLVLLLLQ